MPYPSKCGLFHTVTAVKNTSQGGIRDSTAASNKFHFEG